MTRRSWFQRTGDALSQLANAVLLNGDPDESISGRAYRRGVLERSHRWRRAMHVIDGLFSRWEDRHCFRAYMADQQRARVRAGTGIAPR